jgi:putative FmdB family regulatory protein
LPLYEYQCPECGTFERMQKFSDPVLTACPTCGSPVEKLLSAPAIQFKGSGWYVTDYANKGKEKEKEKEKEKDKAPSETKTKDSSGDKDTGGSKGEGAKKESAPSAKVEKGPSSK